MIQQNRTSSIHPSPGSRQIAVRDKREAGLSHADHVAPNDMTITPIPVFTPPRIARAAPSIVICEPTSEDHVSAARPVASSDPPCPLTREQHPCGCPVPLVWIRRLNVGSWLRAD